jgi:hypothetical protein
MDELQGIVRFTFHAGMVDEFGSRRTTCPTTSSRHGGSPIGELTWPATGWYGSCPRHGTD